MNDELFLEIFHGAGNLFEIVPGFYLADSFSPFDEFVHGLSGKGNTWFVQSSRRI